MANPTFNPESASFSIRGARRVVNLDGVWLALSKPVKMKKVISVTLGVEADRRKESLSFQAATSEGVGFWGGLYLTRSSVVWEVWG